MLCLRGPAPGPLPGGRRSLPEVQPACCHHPPGLLAGSETTVFLCGWRRLKPPPRQAFPPTCTAGQTHSCRAQLERSSEVPGCHTGNSRKDGRAQRCLMCPHVGPESRTETHKRKLEEHFPPIRAMKRWNECPLGNGLLSLEAQRLLSWGAVDLLQGVLRQA